MAATSHNYGNFTAPTPVAAGTRATPPAPNWGSTFLQDLVTKVNFGGYVREQLYGRCQWVQSGIIARNSTLDLSSGGTRIQIPFYRPFLATEEIIRSDATWGASGQGFLTPLKINADSQVAAVMHRGWAFAADDLSAMGTGTDPMAAIASYISDNVLRQRTAALRAIVDGVLGVTALASHTVSVARTSGAASEANFLSAANVIKASVVLGEEASRLTHIAMHSHVYAYLKTIGMLTFSTSSLSTGTGISWGGGGVGITNTQIANFAGFSVVVDDQLAPTTGGANGDTYPVYLFAQGAVQMGIQQDFRVEYERNILSKQSIASVDYHPLLHIDGVSYTGTDNPDNATLGSAASWALKYDPHMIPVVKLIVNCPFAAAP